MADDNNTTHPTNQQILDLQKVIQAKLLLVSNQHKSLRDAYSALNSVRYLSRTVEKTAMIPAVLSDDGSDTIITAEIPAVTMPMYDVPPNKVNNPGKSMTQQDVTDVYNYWNDIINEDL